MSLAKHLGMFEARGRLRMGDAVLWGTSLAWAGDDSGLLQQERELLERQADGQPAKPRLIRNVRAKGA